MSQPYTDIHVDSEDRVRLYARDYAGPTPLAPTVLCLHGLLRNSRDFEELAPHLARRYRVVVPDLRGRGLSARDPNWANYQPLVYARDLMLVASAAGIRQTAIVGTSLGGLVAMMLALGHPGFVTGIVLNDVGPEIGAAGAERIRQYAGRMPPVTSWSEAVAQSQAVYGSALPGLGTERWQALVRRAYRTAASGRPELDADPMIGEAVRASNTATPDLWPAWAALGALPMLALRGELSDILTEATFARMKAVKPDLVQVTVPHRGHAPLLDEPAALAAIDDFLAGLDPAAGIRQS